MTHVLPLNDIYQHIEDKNCLCSPKIEEHDGEYIVIHNSFDNREVLEEELEVIEDT